MYGSCMGESRITCNVAAELSSTQLFLGHLPELSQRTLQWLKSWNQLGWFRESLAQSGHRRTRVPCPHV